MTDKPETDAPPGLADFFAAPAAGMQSPGMEAQILRRVVRRQRLRAIVPGVGALVGVAIAVPGLLAAPLPRLGTGDLLAKAPWKSVLDFIFVSLGEGGLAAIAVAGGLTALGLAFARYLEEV
ncbi:hypothetical protein [Phenylobacterium parvum]|uniref:Uncharacterized protein n=1 Tax=Phenylobacterium parvum TaxID=2201350 RepID=A0A2Z3HVS9_9CAUL|nr:hypothetical protein [Phenylobacterium parvum]AWM77340.1 hypothetical protein HYN04_05910 [Phenylobacterium parvum]